MASEAQGTRHQARGTARGWVTSALCLVSCVLCLSTASAQPIGFRVIEAWDHARTTRPPTDYRGRAATDPVSVPIQIGVWYPAQPGGRPMTFRDLHLVAIRRERFGPVTAQDSAQVVNDMAWAVRISRADSADPAARPEVGLSGPLLAVRDARQRAGAFPVAVVGSSGSIANVSALAEHLASHGWIVLATPSSTQSAGLEVTAPRLAVEDRLRALEFLVAAAHSLPGADVRRLAVIGVNFDSFAALEYQMRSMRAAGVVTINGWQTIENRFEVLRNSPWYDAARIRVPVFNIHWDEDGPGFPPANFGYLRDLRYAERHHIVVRGLDHFGLVGNPLGYPFARREQQAGYRYLMHAVRAFLEGAVRGSLDSARALLTDPATAGYPRDQLRSQWYRAAQPAMPTRREVAEIVWDQRDIARAAGLLREARSRDSTVQLFLEGDLGLYAFRYRAQGRLDDAIAVHRLTIDAYPNSVFARQSIGDLLLMKADTAGTIREYEAALEALARNTRISPQDRTTQEAALREKIAALRPR